MSNGIAGVVVRALISESHSRPHQIHVGEVLYKAVSVRAVQNLVRSAGSSLGTADSNCLKVHELVIAAQCLVIWNVDSSCESSTDI